jgi:dephospho-CoA kinase
MVESLHASKPPIVIGIVGGIASGKSHVSGLFESLGAICVHADQLGHQVLEQPEVITALRRLFGDSVVNAAAELDREQIGRLVFGDTPESRKRRQALEQVVHPRIRQLVEQRIATIKQLPVPPKAILLDAPLLIEAGWANSCDWILFIDSPEELRRERALARGWTSEHFADREASQMKISEKRAWATHLIHNGTNDDVPKQVQELWKSLCGV